MGLELNKFYEYRSRSKFNRITVLDSRIRRIPRAFSRVFRANDEVDV